MLAPDQSHSLVISARETPVWNPRHQLKGKNNHIASNGCEHLPQYYPQYKIQETHMRVVWML